jgi:NADH dehydrogenase
MLAFAFTDDDEPRIHARHLGQAPGATGETEENGSKTDDVKRAHENLAPALSRAKRHTATCRRSVGPRTRFLARHECIGTATARCVMSDHAAGPRHRVVVVGGGFAGVGVCKLLGDQNVDVTLLDRRNFHLFQPLLYQVATGGLSPGDIAAPLRAVLKKQANVEVLLRDVHGVDVKSRTVLTDDAPVPYDTLILCTGARHAYFGHDAWEQHAPGLKTLEDARNIRTRILNAFEQAEQEPDPTARQAWLTFVVVGGGPTGVELAGAIGELAQHTLKGEFRHISSTQAKVLLVEAGPRILAPYVPALSAHGVDALHELGVAVLTNTAVTELDGLGVVVKSAEGSERIAARTVLWGAGVQASPLGKALADQCGCALDRVGRVVVESDLSVPGHPEILVLGDLANFAHTTDKLPLPGIAPVAMQMGAHAARVVERRVHGQRGPAFHYTDKGTMAVIGRNEAVARVGFGLNWNLTGPIAWLMWLFVHVMFLVDFENKVLVMLQWANHYFTRKRGARLIGVDAVHRDPKTA